MHVIDGRKICSLSAASVLAALLIVVVAACGGEEAVPEPVATQEMIGQTEVAPSVTVAVVELVLETPTPYSRNVPSPVVVTATSVPTATMEAATAVPQAFARPTPAAVGSPAATAVIMPTAVVAVTPTAAAAVVPTAQPAPTQVPIATAEPVVMSGDWPTPQELGAVEWGKFRDRGYFTKTVSDDGRITVYEGPQQTRYVTCGPEIGTAFDSTNPSWSESSYWIWVWREKENTLPQCRGASKYEDWVNKPVPAAPLERREWDDLFVKWGEPLKFAADDTIREFSLSDWRDAHYVVGSRIEWDDGWVNKCDETSLPWAVWARERGFYTISIEDEEAFKRREWTDEQVAMKEEGRKRGLYYIWRGLGGEFGGGNYCWHVPNHEEIPPHRPCLECQWRD